MTRRRNKEAAGETDWEAARSELAKWAETPKETPLEKFIREEIRTVTAVLEQGYSCSDIAAWLVEKKYQELTQKV
jgi:hypothetical protein